jgi:hypothetical protein
MKIGQNGIIEMFDCLVDGWFSKRLVFQWVRIVLRYTPIRLYTLMRQTSFKGFSRINIEN